MKPAQPLDPLQRYSIQEAIQYLRTSRKTLYADIKAGRIQTFTRGRRRYVSGSEIARASTGAPIKKQRIYRKRHELPYPELSPRHNLNRVDQQVGWRFDRKVILQARRAATKAGIPASTWVENAIRKALDAKPRKARREANA